jgi:nucleoside-diphosphate-sugar epimerase
MSARRILVTGATGFLGSHLCRELLRSDYLVSAFKRKESHFERVRDIANEIQWHFLPKEIEDPFKSREGIYAVIHCAAVYGRKAFESLGDIIQTNILLPAQLALLANRYSVPLFLNADTVLDPMLSSYALSKHQAVDWLKLACKATRIINLRLQHFYGPDDDNSKFIMRLIEHCLSNVAKIELTEGRQQRDFVYVADVVNAFISILNSKEILNSTDHFLQFEVGSGDAIEIRAVAEIIHRLTESKSELRFGAIPYRDNEPMLTVADVNALRKLGWKPQFTREQGLKETIKAAQNK